MGEGKFMLVRVFFSVKVRQICWIIMMHFYVELRKDRGRSWSCCRISSGSNQPEWLCWRTRCNVSNIKARRKCMKEKTFSSKHLLLLVLWCILWYAFSCQCLTKVVLCHFGAYNSMDFMFCTMPTYESLYWSRWSWITHIIGYAAFAMHLNIWRIHSSFFMVWLVYN